MPITRRRFLSGSSTRPWPPRRSSIWSGRWRPSRPQAASGRAGGAFRHGVASGDPRADRVILWTRVSGAHRRGAGALDAGRQPDVHARRRPRRDLDRRRARLHGEARRRRPDAGDHLLLPLRGARRAVGRSGRTRTLPAAGAAPAARRAGLVLQLPARLLQRLRPDRRAHRRRRRAPPRRLHLRVRTGPLPRPGSAPTARSIRRTEILALDDYRRRYALYRTDPGSAGGAPPASVHRGVGRPRDRQQHLARRRRESPAGRRRLPSPARRRLPGVPRVAAGARHRLGPPAAHLPVVRHRRSRRPGDARHPAGRPRRAGGAHQRPRHRGPAAIDPRPGAGSTGWPASCTSRCGPARAGRFWASR